SAAHLFEPAPAYQFGGRRTGGEFTAQAYFSMSNPGSGAEFRYWLGEDSNENAELVITDSSGEELTTINGQSSKGLHRAVWNMNAASTRLPLSPSEMRDSIAVEARLSVVVDSLLEEGEEEEDVAEAVENLRNAGGGGFNFGGRGGGGGGGAWQDRPAEGRAQAGGGGGRGFGATPAGGGTLQQRIQNAVRPQPAGRGRRGRGGGGLFPGRSEQNGLVEPGTYTVTLKVDGEEFSHTFTVGRADTAPIWQ
ncbi:MAG: hypothetical protein HOF87_13200, partial [Gemmatimonadales bacterium]|nr:hypothetical protein [Gemmatimonadales bacterium]